MSDFMDSYNICLCFKEGEIFEEHRGKMAWIAKKLGGEKNGEEKI